MAKLTHNQWQQVQADYEVRGLSYNELAIKHTTAKSTIRDYIKKHDWVKNKAAPLVEQKASAINALEAINRTTAHMNPHCIEAMAEQVNHLVEFQNAALDNQQKANAMLSESDLSMAELNTHSQITARNKETVLGKSPDTMIDINNNSGLSTTQQEQLKIINDRADAGLG